ncbi:TRADD-N-associated membrane domain-containing protein [Streptomyces olivaceiscleroticus]|uniref:Cyanobacterial TRADD-N associated 2 transmembrane domain-containing protein n=1 Tax=Streptomyces olivaceiscleroticus TaxID=68245 RepID=A0ABN0ZP11_9ACTN
MSKREKRYGHLPEQQRLWLLRVALVAIVLASTVWAITRPTQSWIDWLGFLSLPLGYSALAIAVFFHDREEPQIRESRQRVRDAERDLDAALRASAQHNVYIDGDLVIRTPPDGDAGSADGQVPRAVTDALGTPPSAHLTLPELWKVTHTRLDLYHDIATDQAKRSFRNAQFAMFTGFALLIVFVLIALNASTTAGAVVAGGLGAVSAGLAGFVSRTFVRSQESSATHLRAYFDQPLEFSRYLAAERIIQGHELDANQRSEVLTALVQAMVTGPPAPSDTAGQEPGSNRA